MLSETKRRPGRPKLEQLTETQRAAIVEAALDAFIDRRARSSTEHGFETRDEIMQHQYHERAARERREQWLDYHQSMQRLHARLSEEHAQKYEALLAYGKGGEANGA